MNLERENVTSQTCSNALLSEASNYRLTPCRGECVEPRVNNQPQAVSTTPLYCDCLGQFYLASSDSTGENSTDNH